MQIISSTISIDELRKISAKIFGDMLKAVVDIDRELIAVDAELHADLEAMLLEDGSRQNSLWGINFYPDIEDEDLVEFDSLINIRPANGNTGRGVDSPEVREKILQLVDKLVRR